MQCKRISYQHITSYNTGKAMGSEETPITALPISYVVDLGTGTSLATPTFGSLTHSEPLF